MVYLLTLRSGISSSSSFPKALTSSEPFHSSDIFQAVPFQHLGTRVSRLKHLQSASSEAEGFSWWLLTSQGLVLPVLYNPVFQLDSSVGVHHFLDKCSSCMEAGSQELEQRLLNGSRHEVCLRGTLKMLGGHCEVWTAVSGGMWQAKAGAVKGVARKTMSVNTLLSWSRAGLCGLGNPLPSLQS